MTETTIRTYTVHGMTCDHCVRSVKEELSEVAGVEDVTVGLAEGRVEVTGAGVGVGDVRAAVEEAGYELAESR